MPAPRFVSSFLPPLAAAAVAVTAFTGVVPARAAQVTMPADFDRLMYPHAATGGTRGDAYVFGAVNADGADDRSAQLLVGFNTAAAAVPAGLGAASYAVSSVSVTLYGSNGGYLYDPTYDAAATYVTPANDSDAGRPIELFGVGFRNGYTRLAFGADDGLLPTFEETTGFPFGATTGTRNAFAINGYDGAGAPKDVSNSIRNGAAESNPWAIGAAGAPAGGPAPAAGGAVAAGTPFTFSLDLTDPAALAYVRQGLNDGSLGFAVTTLLVTGGQGAGSTYPIFHTREGLFAEFTPSLNVQYAIVPEPASVGLLAGAAAYAGLRRRRYAAAAAGEAE